MEVACIGLSAIGQVPKQLLKSGQCSAQVIPPAGAIVHLVPSLVWFLNVPGGYWHFL